LSSLEGKTIKKITEQLHGKRKGLMDSIDD